MGDWFFGEDPETQMTVYGELPGMNELAQQLWPVLGGWLGAWTTGVGQQYPGAGEAQYLWDVSGPAGELGRQRLSQMLGPGWAEEAPSWLDPMQTPPGLAQIEAARRAQMEQDLEDMRGALRMEFGGHGQTFSSPMIGRMAREEMTARGGLEDYLGQQRFADYQQRMGQRFGLLQQKLGMLPGLLGTAIEQPFRAAGLIGQRGDAMINALLQYLATAKGQPFMTQTGGSPGLLDIAGAVAPFLP